MLISSKVPSLLFWLCVHTDPGSAQTRRDDLQALVYTIFFFALGREPKSIVPDGFSRRNAHGLQNGSVKASHVKSNRSLAIVLALRLVKNQIIACYVTNWL